MKRGFVLLTHKNKVLMLLRARGKWTFPGGRQDEGESMEDAARRELFEEAGLKVSKLKETKRNGKYYYFKATLGKKVTPTLSPEHITHCWIPIQQLNKLALARPVRTWLKTKKLKTGSSVVVADKKETTLNVVFGGDGDGASNLANMIAYIGLIGGYGHSFEIVVDPETSDYTKKFDFDGDGSDRVLSVDLDGESIKGKKK